MGSPTWLERQQPIRSDSVCLVTLKNANKGSDVLCPDKIAAPGLPRNLVLCEFRNLLFFLKAATSIFAVDVKIIHSYQSQQNRQRTTYIVSICKCWKTILWAMYVYKYQYNFVRSWYSHIATGNYSKRYTHRLTNKRQSKKWYNIVRIFITL